MIIIILNRLIRIKFIKKQAGLPIKSEYPAFFQATFKTNELIENLCDYRSAI